MPPADGASRSPGVDAEHAEARATGGTALQRAGLDAAHLFALCGFGVAQPLFDLLGKNPTFFVAHDVSGFGLVAFAFALLVVPPLVLVAVLLAVRVVSAAAARAVRAAFVGVLVALTLLPPLERAVGLSTVAWVSIGLVAAVAAAFAYDRLRGVRTFAGFLVPAPMLFLVVFLFFSPAHTLVSASDPAAASVDLQGTRTPVVVVVLDQLASGVLLDESGKIDAARYPGFAHLAEVSTWYPHATTVALNTVNAVPAILTGRTPEGSAVPIAADHPRSLFTLLGRTHRLHADEPVTHLCPESFCGGEPAAQAAPSFTDDLGVLYLHSALPRSLARQWLPAINNRWSGFGEESQAAPRQSADERAPASDEFYESATREHKVALDRFEAFLAAIDRPQGSAKPDLWFLHTLLSHGPYTFLPDGQIYTDSWVVPGLEDQDGSIAWSGDRDVVAASLQRLVLQTKLVDRLVDRLLDRLRAAGVLDDALVVVTADHGEVFLPDSSFTAVDGDAGDHLLPVPLFVKYPGQSSGEVDDRDARTIDVLPTIVDTFDAEVPAGWSFDGRSLRGAPRHVNTYEVLPDPTETVRTIPAPVDFGGLANMVHEYLGAGGGDHDGFRFGPYGALVGQDAASLATGDPNGTISADDWAAFDAVNLDGRIPALLEATLTGIEAGEWLAVALDGTIAGLGPTYSGSGGATRTTVMLDWMLFQQGANRVDVYRVDPGGPTLRPITRS